MPGMLEFQVKKLSLHSAADAAEHIYGSLEILFDGEIYQFGGDGCLQSWLECLRRLSKFVAGGDATRDPTTFWDRWRQNVAPVRGDSVTPSGPSGRSQKWRGRIEHHDS